MQDHHKKILDDVFAEVDLRRKRDAAEKELRAAEKRKFDDSYVALITKVVRPTFTEFQSYLASKGMEGFIDYVPPEAFSDDDDIPAEYYCRFTFGQKTVAAAHLGYIEVVAVPRERSMALQTKYKSGERIVKTIVGPNSPVLEITTDVLHGNLAHMLRVILA